MSPGADPAEVASLRARRWDSSFRSVPIYGGEAGGPSSAMQPSAYLSLASVKGWEPDGACVQQGDEFVVLALRCYAAAGMGNRAIKKRLLDYAEEMHPAKVSHSDAAVAVARHMAFAGMAAREIVTMLARLAVQVPAWPDDPDELAAIARFAERELAS